MSSDSVVSWLLRETLGVSVRPSEDPGAPLYPCQQQIGTPALTVSPPCRFPAWSQGPAPTTGGVRVGCSFPAAPLQPPGAPAGPSVLRVRRLQRGAAHPPGGEPEVAGTLPTRPKETNDICIAFGVVTVAAVG